jgi:hypothetical protein
VHLRNSSLQELMRRSFGETAWILSPPVYNPMTRLILEEAQNYRRVFANKSEMRAIRKMRHKIEKGKNEGITRTLLDDYILPVDKVDLYKEGTALFHVSHTIS